MDIDEKLNKSLDELIKEEENNRKSAKGNKGANNNGAKAGKGRPSTGKGRGERRSGANGDRMDVDTPAGGGSRPLKAQGGVQKKKTGRAPQDRAPHEKRVPQEKSIPRGNVEGKWSHDLHEDSGPVRPRKFAQQAQKMQNTAVEIHRRLLVENVPNSVTKEDMFDLVAAAGSREQVENISRQATGHSVKYVIDFMTEKAAYKVYNKYQDVALDDRPVKMRVVGMSMPQTLKSGVRVSKAGQSGGGKPHASGGVRGRGTSGAMRSDRMME